MKLIPLTTRDGSLTYFNATVGDSYHMHDGGLKEAYEKHAKGLHVDACASDPIILLDVCFGLGYNTLAAIDVIRKKDPEKKIVVHCFENDKEILEHAEALDFDHPYLGLMKTFLQSVRSTAKVKWTSKGITWIMHPGDVRETIKKVANEAADFCFYDPFSPAKVPELWTVELMHDVFSKMKKGAKLSTYSYARWVRENFRKAGFVVTDGPVMGRRSPSTLAIVPI